MAIKQRNFVVGSVQEPARVAAPHVPSKDAVLTGGTANTLRTAGHLTYSGTNPMQAPVDDLTLMVRDADNDTDLDHSYRNRIRSKGSAIRAFCVLCASGAKGARMCEVVDCALWSFRMGNNPLNRK
jgi:hypothetical protein